VGGRFGGGGGAVAEHSAAFRVVGADPAQSVLAVVVVYERNIDQVEAWVALCTELGDGREQTCPHLHLKYILVYDNSSLPRACPAETSDGRISYVHDGSNGGTAAAYACAAKHAAKHGIGWLLLVDHDTNLPPNLFKKARAALTACGDSAPALLLPWVRQGAITISPSRITQFGTIRPLSGEMVNLGNCAISGIASGSLIRVSALRSLLPFPPALWLDYVDHWICAGLQRQGLRLATYDAELEHKLSVLNIDTVSPSRLRSVLDGESFFVRSLPWPARWYYPLRLLVRAFRYLPHHRGHALFLARYSFRIVLQGI